MAGYFSSRDTASMSVAVFDSIQKQQLSPLHSASVSIIEFPDSFNPQPQSSSSYLYSDSEDEGMASRAVVSQDYLTPLKLMQLSGEPDLMRVTSLELSVNTTENSLGSFGSYLPNLEELRFIDSVVPCVRDLGTGLPSIKILWMARCSLKDLDGLTALSCLKEFYLAFNEVEDVSVVAMLSYLEVLDLESNNVSETDQLDYLALCPSLRAVTLEGNPLSIALAADMNNEAAYRAAVHERVPCVLVLDDVPLSACEEVDKEGRNKLDLSATSVFKLSEAGMQEDWRILQHSIKERFHIEEGLGEVSVGTRPRTAPCHAQRSASLSPPAHQSHDDDESSELTHGLSQVICGNPVRALRARKKYGLRSTSAIGHHRSATTTPTRLDPVCEDIVVTRAISEENLFQEEQQPDLLLDTQSSPTPHSPFTSSPTSLTQVTTSTPSPTSFHDVPMPPTPPKAPASDDTHSFRHRRYRKPSAEFQ